jgi:hypothetical protein
MVDGKTRMGISLGMAKSRTVADHICWVFAGHGQTPLAGK